MVDFLLLPETSHTVDETGYEIKMGRSPMTKKDITGTIYYVWYLIVIASSLHTSIILTHSGELLQL